MIKYRLISFFFLFYCAGAVSQVVEFKNVGCRISSKDISYVERIVRFESALYNNLFNTRSNDSLHIKVTVFGNPDEYRGVFLNETGGKGHGTNGFYSHRLNESFLYKRPEYLQTVVHEISHCMLAHNFSRAPRWLQEGMAEFCETLTIEDNKIVFSAQRSRINSVVHTVKGQPLKLREFFNSNRWGEKAQTPVLYDISYAVIYYLIKKNPNTLKQMLSYMGEGHSSIDAIEYSYGGFYNFENDFNRFYKNTLVKVF